MANGTEETIKLPVIHQHPLIFSKFPTEIANASPLDSAQKYTEVDFTKLLKQETKTKHIGPSALKYKDTQDKQKLLCSALRNVVLNSAREYLKTSQRIIKISSPPLKTMREFEYFSTYKHSYEGDTDSTGNLRSRERRLEIGREFIVPTSGRSLNTKIQSLRSLCNQSTLSSIRSSTKSSMPKLYRNSLNLHDIKPVIPK